MPKLARAGGDAASSKKCAQKPSLVNNSRWLGGNNYPVPAEFRLRCAVEQIDALGSVRVRVVYELLLELGHRHEILDDIATLAAKYAARLTPRLLRLAGGDRLPPLPIFLVPPGAE